MSLLELKTQQSVNNSLYVGRDRGDIAESVMKLTRLNLSVGVIDIVSNKPESFNKWY